ncbi:MAG TPA: hypothetical protein VFY43_08495, partial [Candidatus Limnocylindria bacterium]|nr:hypothetical protein [Candidatus Limnocylindria bacterium]
SSHFGPDRRLTMKEGTVLVATTNTNGSYILVVNGQADPTDYKPLKRYLRQELERLSRSAARQSPGPSPSGGT